MNFDAFSHQHTPAQRGEELLDALSESTDFTTDHVNLNECGLLIPVRLSNVET
jgi:hypothetical protein